MRKNLFAGLMILVFPILCSTSVAAQRKISFDMAAIRQMENELSGLNLSCFYHFTERLNAGIELNRFFPVTHKGTPYDTRLSAWDFDLNVHYLLPLHKSWSLYPVVGISHTKEMESTLIPLGEAVQKRFWSFNTGAGISWQKGQWGVHTEYLFTWGKLNQQFLLAGLSYELELCGHKEKKVE
jgi:hypothetical protein